MGKRTYDDACLEKFRLHAVDSGPVIDADGAARRGRTASEGRASLGPTTRSSTENVPL